jgi:hypothetical protein
MGDSFYLEPLKLQSDDDYDDDDDDNNNNKSSERSCP